MECVEWNDLAHLQEWKMWKYTVREIHVFCRLFRLTQWDILQRSFLNVMLLRKTKRLFKSFISRGAVWRRRHNYCFSFDCKGCLVEPNIEQKVTANGLTSVRRDISVGRLVIWGITGGQFLARTEDFIFTVQSGPYLEHTKVVSVESMKGYGEVEISATYS
jgi:hypothetical protein